MSFDGPEVILEGKWNCAQCRTKGIPGGQTNCPTCGDPRNELLDQSEEVYLPDDARVVTDPGEIAAAHAGPNWNCGKCGQSNPGNAKVCGNCGDPFGTNDNVNQVRTYVSGAAAQGVHLDDAATLDADHVDAVLQGADKLQPLADGAVTMPGRTLADSALPTHGTEGPLYGSRDSGPPGSSSSSPSRWRNRKFLTIVGAAVAVVLVLALGGVFLFKNTIATHQVNLKVQSLSWERQIGIDADKTFTRTGWQVPLGGHVISSRMVLKGYNRVFDHWNYQNTTVKKQTGTKPTHYACGTKKVSLGNGKYSSTTKYCNGSTPVYGSVPTTIKTKVYRNVPVLARQYTYLITQWVFDHYVTASGTTNPHDPTPDNHGSLQRVGSERHDVYTVVVTDATGKRFTETTNQSTWSRLHVGQTLKGAENHHGSLRGVTWPTS